ncbi:MAG: LD-carboxypeptidase, partial [Bacteroidota bacterium]
NFQKKIATAAIGLPFVGNIKTTEPQLKAKKLNKGDTVGLISPGSYIDDRGFERAVKNLEGLGLNVKLASNVRAKKGYLAGSDVERLDDLHSMFADREVAGVWCVRGGYGCTRLLPNINYDLIRANPKPIIGYSDITALLQAIYIETGLVGFHGPVASSNFTRYTTRYVRRTLFQEKRELEIEFSRNNLRKGKRDSAYEKYTISPGKARGKLIGGNLSILASLAGTRWEVDIRDHILFIEDIGEKPYRIDRMLTQLRQSTNLRRARAIALGVFEDCEAGRNDLSLSLKETLTNRLGDLNIPVLYGLSFGHITDQFTLPIGITAELDATRQTLTFLENGVV